MKLENLTQKWVHLKLNNGNWMHFKGGDLMEVPDDTKFLKTQCRIVSNKVSKPVEEKEIKKTKKKKRK